MGVTANLWKEHMFTVAVSSAGTSPAQILSYDTDLSRVRIDLASLTAQVNANSTFEADVSGWSATEGTLSQSTTQHHSGAASMLLTPGGANPPQLNSNQGVPVVGQQYTASAWFWSQAGWGQVEIEIDYYDSTGTFLSWDTGPPTAIPAGAWTQLTVSSTAPTGAAGIDMWIYMDGTPTTPSASDLLYIDDAVLTPSWPAGSTWTVQRSTDLVRWSTVRGGGGIDVGTTIAPIDDYEFTPSIENHYRVQVWNGTVLLHTYSDAITPLLSDVWLKNIARPYLNRTVSVADAGDMSMPARMGVFDVVGSQYPVAVTDVRGSGRYELTLETSSADDARDLRLSLAPGDTIYLQVPPDYPLDTGYYVIGDLTRSWRNAPPAQVPLRWWTLPLIEVAAPAADVVGVTVTWTAAVNTFASWTDLLAAAATWADLADAVASPEDVIVS